MRYEEREAWFLQELRKRSRRVKAYLQGNGWAQQFAPAHIRDSVYSYIRAGGKLLRPGVLLFSCGAVGGDEERALPAAGGIEVFHTWTMVHDDIIDRDEKRRGSPTVHEAFRVRAEQELGFDLEEARHYGASIGILAGDVQHGWAVSLLTALTAEQGVSASVALALIRELDGPVLNTLVEGQVLDVQYSKWPMEGPNPQGILDMLWKKTGALFEFAGRAGAMVGLDSADGNHEWIRAIAQFTSRCGTAFQLQDDILGVIGDEHTLGKPVGSDIREGKRTTVVYFALEQADDAQRARLLSIVGHRDASDRDIVEARWLLEELGGIERTRQLAQQIVVEALGVLDPLPPSSYRDLLATWADYIIRRTY